MRKQDRILGVQVTQAELALLQRLRALEDVEAEARRKEWDYGEGVVRMAQCFDATHSYVSTVYNPSGYSLCAASQYFVSNKYPRDEPESFTKKLTRWVAGWRA